MKRDWKQHISRTAADAGGRVFKSPNWLLEGFRFAVEYTANFEF